MDKLEIDSNKNLLKKLYSLSDLNSINNKTGIEAASSVGEKFEQYINSNLKFFHPIIEFQNNQGYNNGNPDLNFTSKYDISKDLDKFLFGRNMTNEIEKSNYAVLYDSSLKNPNQKKISKKIFTYLGEIKSFALDQIKNEEKEEKEVNEVKKEKKKKKKKLSKKKKSLIQKRKQSKRKYQKIPIRKKKLKKILSHLKKC